MILRLISIMVVFVCSMFSPHVWGYTIGGAIGALTNFDACQVSDSVAQTDGPTQLSLDSGLVMSCDSAEQFAQASADGNMGTGQLAMYAESSEGQVAASAVSFNDTLTFSLPVGMASTQVVITMTTTGSITGNTSGGLIRLRFGTAIDQLFPLSAFSSPYTATVTGDMVMDGDSIQIVAAIQGVTEKFPSSLIDLSSSVSIEVEDGVTFTSESGLTLSDQDNDLINDATDNCVLESNADQQDADGDGYGNRCDADYDNNCIINFLDVGLFANAFMSSDPVFDTNSDGAVNFLDYSLVVNSIFGQPGPGLPTGLCE